MGNHTGLPLHVLASTSAVDDILWPSRDESSDVVYRDA